jgi:serine/threonine protein kinase
MIQKRKIYLEDLGIAGNYSLEDIPTLSSSLLPTLTLKSELRMPNKSLRCYLYLKQIVNGGSFGEIRIATRMSAEKQKQQDVYVKSPRLEAMNLQSEALLQSCAHKCLVRHSIDWAVPKVHDIFTYQNKIHFSMDMMEGVFLDKWFQQSKSPDTDFFLMMAQLSIFLCLLHQCIGLDHRDLKADNLLISPHPCRLQFQYNTHTYTLDCPFRVHILDFGFACLGNGSIESSPAFITLGDGILPAIDPCPKEGRDLFQFLLSLLCVKTIRSVLSSSSMQSIESWTGKKFMSMAQKMSEDTSWIYLLTSSPEFTSPKSTPYSVLRDIVLLAPEYFKRT